MGFVANKQAHVLDAVHWYMYPGVHPVLRQPVHDTALPQPTHYQTCSGVRALILTSFEGNHLLVWCVCRVLSTLLLVYTVYRGVYISLFISIVLHLVVGFTGLIIYAYYVNCDPLKSGLISKRDQVGTVYSNISS